MKLKFMRNKAFTLVELLVVIGIIALLITLGLPMISRANQQAKSVQCLSNLRQISAATMAYVQSNRGSFPIAYFDQTTGNRRISYCWDFTSTRDLSTGQLFVAPGLIWAGDSTARVQRCPVYDGKSNSAGDPFTGYNYNTSYIGHGQYEDVVEPARIEQIRMPSRCALFGDGQYYGGADKFMRSPLPGSGDQSFTNRAAGTQGFRHAGRSGTARTNVIFADGHADSIDSRHVNTSSKEMSKLTADTGFLSDDNSLYGG